MEIPCLLPIPEKNAVITGVIDLPCRDGNDEPVIAGCKTGAFHDEYRWQLSVYGHCAETPRGWIYHPFLKILLSHGITSLAIKGQKTT